jgi:DNA-binding MarR family transcriptional regulator
LYSAKVQSQQRVYFDRLVRHETALWNLVDRSMRGEGVLGLGRLTVLRHVSDSDAGARVQSIAERVGTTRSAASKLVDRLHFDGLVDRAPADDDRRGVLVTLTALGRRTLDASEARFDEALGAALAALSAAELRQAAELLAKVDAALGAAGAPAA